MTIETSSVARAIKLPNSRYVRAGALEVSYFEAGPSDGTPVALLHGFPYSAHAYEGVVEILARNGCRLIVPSLRGFGATRFLNRSTMRSGQQAALGADLLALLDALQVGSAVLAGYDWGGRAACVVAALWPERCNGLVSCNGYNIQNIATAMVPDIPANEHRLWYQYFFHSERGLAALQRDREAFLKLLWQLWSPNWRFDEQEFYRSAKTWDNSDFVDVVIHSYRHRFGLVSGDPVFDDIERRLAEQPPITVPAVTLDGADDGVIPARVASAHSNHFSGPREHRLIEGAGHNLPQERPEIFAQAVLDVLKMGGQKLAVTQVL